MGEDHKKRAAEIVDHLDGTDSHDQCVSVIAEALRASENKGAREGVVQVLDALQDLINEVQDEIRRASDGNDRHTKADPGQVL